MPKGKLLKHLGVLCMSGSNLERELDSQVGAASAVRRVFLIVANVLFVKLDLF